MEKHIGKTMEGGKGKEGKERKEFISRLLVFTTFYGHRKM